MTKESIKHKINTKKLNVTPSNSEFDTFLKNQQNIVSRLKTELKSVIGKVQPSDSGTVEKDKILELEHSINQREGEIHKLNVSLDQLKEENSKILLELNFFKEKFYQLETTYDRDLHLQNHENENLRAELQNQQTTENQQIQKLSLECQNLQQTLQEKIKDLNHLNKYHAEILQNYEQMKLNFERQQKEFELYKKQVSDEKREEERSKLDFDNLKEELRQKDELIKQCISDKNGLEKEKNLIIDELNNKICRIERAFSQPTKVVPPMTTLRQEFNSSDINSSSECSIDNAAITKPQARKPLENLSVQSLSNIENQKVEENQIHRDYKFKRPIPLTSTQLSNTSTNRKRRNLSLRQPSAILKYNEFSSSSDEDDDKEERWRPNNECYVADTDESGGFLKSKRSKK